MAVVTKDKDTDTPPAEAPLAEISMPDGMTLEDFERQIAEPEAEAPEEPAKEEPKPEAPAAPVATTPAPEPPKERKGDLSKALKEERQKRKTAEAKVRNLWEEVKQQKQQGYDRLSGRPIPGQVAFDPKDGARVEQIGKQAEEAEAAGKGMRPAVEATLREAQRLAQEAANRAVMSVPTYIMQIQEQELREELFDSGENYDEILEKSGIFAATRQDAQGNFADPVVARMIYSSANPAKRALKLAKQKIASETKPAREDDDEPETPAPVAQTPAVPPAPAAPAPAPTADAVAEARRAGAREVAETVATHSKRPQGVRLLRDAGQPVKVGLNRAFWNQLNAWQDRALGSTDEGGKWLDYLDANPTIRDWFMQGPPPA